MNPNNFTAAGTLRSNKLEDKNKASTTSSSSVSGKSVNSALQTIVNYRKTNTTNKNLF